MIKFFIKLIKSFLRNFEKVDDSYFETNFNLFKKAKSHVWTHVIMYTTWISPLSILGAADERELIGGIGITLLLYALGYAFSILVFIIENTFYPKYKLKRRFVYESFIFSIFWLIGQIIPIVITIYLCYCFLSAIFKTGIKL